MIRFPALAALALAALGLGLAAPPIRLAAAAGPADRGAELFKATGCYECHGTVGQGGAAGPRLAPNPLPTEAIQAYIRQPPGQMPPYAASLLSDQDIAAIHAYLAGIKAPPPSVVEEKMGPAPKFESKASP